jgi:hypothetical protein
MGQPEPRALSEQTGHGHRWFVYHTAPGRGARHAARLALVALVALVGLAHPAPAHAHGPIDPEASDDLARITHVPAGLQARVVDGDLRLWLQVPRSERVTVLDYQGAPYLRFTRDGVQTNENSPMFYLNLVPPITPSIRLTAHLRPAWHQVSHGRVAEWHDGRLAALATDLQAPGARVLGDWYVPLLINGRPARITGVLDHAPRPSWGWMWPIAAALLMLPALLRLRDAGLERRVGTVLVAVTLAGIVVASLGSGLHGRPGLSGFRLAIMFGELLIAGWCTVRLTRRRSGPLVYAATASVALLRGVTGIAVLWRGYVLLAVPAAVGRGAIVVCLAGGVALAVLTVAIVDRRDRPSPRPVTAGS